MGEGPQGRPSVIIGKRFVQIAIEGSKEVLSDSRSNRKASMSGDRDPARIALPQIRGPPDPMKHLIRTPARESQLIPAMPKRLLAGNLPEIECQRRLTGSILVEKNFGARGQPLRIGRPGINPRILPMLKSPSARPFPAFKIGRYATKITAILNVSS